MAVKKVIFIFFIGLCVKKIESMEYFMPFIKMKKGFAYKSNIDASLAEIKEILNLQYEYIEKRICWLKVEGRYDQVENFRVSAHKGLEKIIENHMKKVEEKSKKMENLDTLELYVLRENKNLAQKILLYDYENALCVIL
jgi:hypothetical protein